MLTTAEWSKLMIFQKEVQDLKFRKTLDNRDIIMNYLNTEIEKLKAKQVTK